MTTVSEHVYHLKQKPLPLHSPHRPAPLFFPWTALPWTSVGLESCHVWWCVWLFPTAAVVGGRCAVERRPSACSWPCGRFVYLLVCAWHSGHLRVRTGVYFSWGQTSEALQGPVRAARGWLEGPSRPRWYSSRCLLQPSWWVRGGLSFSFALPACSANDAERLPIRLLAICLCSSGKRLFRSFAHF